jgi:hypothetical protein
VRALLARPLVRYGGRVDAAQAISLVVERIRAEGVDYPTVDLTAARFLGGWCVYAPDMIADADPADDVYAEVTRSVFLVGDSGRVEQVSSSEPVEDARQWFEEACIWFGAQEPRLASADPSLPSTPDLGGSRRPARPTAAYDRRALDALADALTHERDFAGWLADRLRELADLVGGSSRLVVHRQRSPEATHVQELADGDGPADAWRTWPAVDATSLPDVDTAGWLLVPGVAVCEYLESLESETGAATRLADVVADHVGRTPPWRACGVAELVPQLVAVPRGAEFDADLDTLRRVAAEADGDDVADVLLAPSPDEPDAEALLRIAVDAQQRQRDVIDIDAAATAAYRRVLDRMGIPLENYWYEAMFE